MSSVSNLPGRAGAALRVISAVALLLAAGTSVVMIALRLVHCVQPNLLPWKLKSAIPLILAGTAFACLQFALPRTRAQMLAGLMVAAAFILWGIEQFLPNRAVAAFLDDVVVLLFVLDLSIVIIGQLKPVARPIARETGAVVTLRR